MFVYFFNEKPLRIKLTESCLRMVFLCFEKIKEFAANGVIPNIVNNSLLTKIIKDIDYKKSDDKKFTESQKLLLEIYLSLNDLTKAVKEKTNVSFDSILETTIGISQVKRAKTIIREREKFNFLKYYIHHQSLKDHEHKLMNQNIETSHPCFDTKNVGKFSINQVERIKINMNEKMELKPFTFLGIGSKADGSDMVTYTAADFKKESTLEFNRSHFYTFYPIKKQMVVGFGDNKGGRLGSSESKDIP